MIALDYFCCTPDGRRSGVTTMGQLGISLHDGHTLETLSHECGHALGILHSFHDSNEQAPLPSALSVTKGSTKNYMDYTMYPRVFFYLYQMLNHN